MKAACTVHRDGVPRELSVHDEAQGQRAEQDLWPLVSRPLPVAHGAPSPVVGDHSHDWVPSLTLEPEGVAAAGVASSRYGRREAS